MLILCYCHRRGRAIVIAREDLTTLFFVLRVLDVFRFAFRAIRRWRSNLCFYFAYATAPRAATPHPPLKKASNSLWKVGEG